MKFMNPELSWLAFNHRVLQESIDKRNPLIERIKFLGIYSNNLDEFFRVKVAQLKRSIRNGDLEVFGFDGSPRDLLEHIKKEVLRQRRLFDWSYQNLLTELGNAKVRLIDEQNLFPVFKEEVSAYFYSEIRHLIEPIYLEAQSQLPTLRDNSIYLAVELRVKDKKKSKYALVEVPKELPRFLKFDSQSEERHIMMIDDVIRLHLLHIFRSFKPESAAAFTFKFSRDAEIDLEEDEDLSYVDRMNKGIKKRKYGAPVRMVYDSNMPETLVEFLRLKLGLKEHENIIPGGKYHNFRDFMGFPSLGNPNHHYTPQPPIDHPTLTDAPSLFKECMKRDTLLHFPYQKFTHIIELLREAALDPKVESIHLNIYRAAKDSKVLNALITALRNGKRVVVIFELLARFDEENNIYWSQRLKENGAEIKYGLKGYKVHSKLMLIQRVSRGERQELVYIGTGNFNEKTALIYEDFAFLTSNKTLVEEVKQIFDFMVDKKPIGSFQELIVSPFNSREQWEKLIDEEIVKGKKGRIFLKMNSLNDAQMIEKLYEASNAGVVVQIVCRGMCCLVPGVPNQSENIEVRSIVGRYLEHSRVFCFGSKADDRKIFIGSSDWMQRNLDRRIEVVTPIHSERLKKQVMGIMKMLWSGNQKARIIDANQTNKYVRFFEKAIDAQATIYQTYMG